MGPADCTAALEALGFTALEAEVYAVLVTRSPATAYKVAQEIGKATANVYKAVESLQRKGALLVDESATRLCRAVPPTELMGQLERQFAQARERAETALAALGQPGADERVYELTSPDQVLARARAMLRATERVALCDLFPEAALELRDDVNAAARRGRHVCVQVYAPTDFDPRVTVFVTTDGARLLEAWRGQWLNVAIDGREHLLAFLHDGLTDVHQAVWSASAYLSILYFSGLASEMLTSAATSILREGPAPLRRRFEQVASRLHASDLPGARDLKARFAARTPTTPATPKTSAKRRRG